MSFFTRTTTKHNPRHWRPISRFGASPSSDYISRATCQPFRGHCTHLRPRNRAVMKAYGSKKYSWSKQQDLMSRETQITEWTGLRCKMEFWPSRAKPDDPNYFDGKFAYRSPPRRHSRTSSTRWLTDARATTRKRDYLWCREIMLIWGTRLAWGQGRIKYLGLACVWGGGRGAAMIVGINQWWIASEHKEKDMC